MILPPELLEAISTPGGGKITLVVGAGCSVETPTSIPAAAICSQQCHDRLVANGILAHGDCPKPSNLTCLADAVYAKTGSQQALVEQLLHHYTLKAASPNEGHLITAALLREGAIASVLTLNFDLALSTAIAQLGVGDRVGIIDGPDELGNQNAFNLFYLHRNANTGDAELWVLRTEVLQREWRGAWEAVIAARVLTTPVVLFVGIGSSADVLVESSKLIRNAIPEKSHAYQVSPGDAAHSEFFKALEIDPRFFVQGRWSEFMTALSHRLVLAQALRVRAAADQLVNENPLTPEDLDEFMNRLVEIGLLGFGGLRANWLLYATRYLADEPLISQMVADLVLAAALIARVTDTTAILFDDGRVEFQRDGRVVATHLFASGRGTRSRTALEAELSLRHTSFRRSGVALAGAIISGTTGIGAAAITPPRDVVLGDTSDSIIFGRSGLSMFHVDSLRDDTANCRLVAP